MPVSRAFLPQSAGSATTSWRESRLASLPLTRRRRHLRDGELDNQPKSETRMKSYRLFAFLAAALITVAFLMVMITNDMSVAQQVIGAAVTDATADTQSTSN
jgi:hypothetical protein